MSAGGRDDPNARPNPFASAVPASGGSFMQPSSASQPMGSPVQATSPLSGGSSNPLIAMGQGYSPLRDPEGPLARAGWIGALLANGPSKTEYLTSIKAQQEQAIGQSRAKAFQTLGGLVSQGLTPQKAFLQFINTPEGVDFLVKDPDPQAAATSFLKLATPDPVLAARAAAFADTPANATGGQAPVGTNQGPVPSGAAAAATPATQPSGPNMNTMLSPEPVAGAPMQQTPPANETGGNAPTVDPSATLPGDNHIASLTDANRYLQISKRLLAAGDKEGADAALKMAEQSRLLNTPPTNADIEGYHLAVSQAKAAGTTPPSWVQYKTSMNRSVATQNNINTVEGAAAKQTAARITVDTQAAIEAGKTALKVQQALPALEEAARLSKTLPGGYAASYLPILSRIGTSFGMDVPKNWSDAEAMTAITQQLLPIVRQPGAVSDYEQRTYTNALPNLLQSPQGRQKVIEIMQRQAQRAQEVAEVYRDHIGEPDLYTHWLADLDKPMFSKDEMASFEKAAATGQPVQDVQKPIATDTGKSGMEVVTDQAGFDAIKPGALYKDDEGNIHQKPKDTTQPAPVDNRGMFGGKVTKFNGQ